MLLRGSLFRGRSCAVSCSREGFGPTQLRPLSQVLTSPLSLFGLPATAWSRRRPLLRKDTPAQPSLCLFLAWQGLLPCWATGGARWQVSESQAKVCSVQHGIQLVSQGIKHGADIIQNVLGRRPCGATSRGNLDEMGQWVL